MPCRTISERKGPWSYEGSIDVTAWGNRGGVGRRGLGRGASSWRQGGWVAGFKRGSNGKGYNIQNVNEEYI